MEIYPGWRGIPKREERLKQPQRRGAESARYDWKPSNQAAWFTADFYSTKIPHVLAIQVQEKSLLFLQ